MTDYPFDMQLVVDPLNPENVVRGGDIYLYDPSDAAGVSPIAVKDPSGLPLPNPLKSNAHGFLPPTILTIPRVKWKSGPFEGFFYSYDGLRNEAIAARAAAEEAAAAAQASASLVIAPTDDVVAAVLMGDTEARAKLDARYSQHSDLEAFASASDQLFADRVGDTTSGWWNAILAKIKSLFVGKGELVVNVRDYGAKGDGATDDTAAIRAAVSAATPGTAIYFPPTGSGAWYKITDTITITTPSLRFLGNPRDIYAVSIKCTVANKVMLSVKAPAFVFQHMGLIGDATGANGLGATVTGIELFGDTDGNVDANLWNACFLNLAVPVRNRGRNLTASNDTLISNSLKGIVIDGVDGTYHTGPNAAENRGNTIRNCRFHNIGAAATDAHIEITSAAKVLHALIDGNYFDSNGFGVHIRATGTSTNPHKGISMWNNKHTECQSEAYALTYVNNSTISDADIQGYAGGLYGNGFTINNCDTLVVRNVLGIQIGKTGLYARNSPNLDLNNVNFAQVGQNGVNTSHGFDIDSTNNNPVFTRLRVGTSPGWGFVGSPFQPSMIDSRFLTAALGAISSTTVTNRAALGRNTFIEGSMGRMEDEGRQVYDFSAGVAKQVATIASAGNFSSFLFTVEFTARDGGGDCYAFGRYSVRTENGAPVVTALGAANLARVAVTTAASGTQGITVSLTCTAAASGTVIVRASAGGASNTTNPRGVTVAMA